MIITVKKGFALAASSLRQRKRKRSDTIDLMGKPHQLRFDCHSQPSGAANYHSASISPHTRSCSKMIWPPQLAAAPGTWEGPACAQNVSISDVRAASPSLGVLVPIDSCCSCLPQGLLQGSCPPIAGARSIQPSSFPNLLGVQPLGGLG